MPGPPEGDTARFLLLFDAHAPAVLEWVRRQALDDERPDLTALVAATFRRAWDLRGARPDEDGAPRAWLRDLADDSLLDYRLHGLSVELAALTDSADTGSELSPARDWIAAYVERSSAWLRWRERLLSAAPTAGGVALVGLLAVAALTSLRPPPDQSTAGSQAQPAPSSAPVPDGPPQVAAFRMVSRGQGWVLLDTPDQRLSDVMRTVDGGAHWTPVSPPILKQPPTRTPDGIAYVTAAYFLDANHAWLAATDRPKPRASALGVTYWTADGGRTWALGQPFGAVGTPRSVQFLDARHGFLTAQTEPDVNMLFTSVDGGAVWTLTSDTYRIDSDARASGAPQGCRLIPPTFLDTGTGWLTGSCSAHGPLFLVTRDGGQHWRRQPLPPTLSPAGNPTLGICGGLACSASAPRFTSPRDGFFQLIIDQAQPWIYLTNDGGVSWSPRALLMSADPAGAAAGLDFADGRRGMAISWLGAGAILTTADGGQTWRSVPSQLGRILPTLQLLSPDEAWIHEPGSGWIAHTTDAGVTWTFRFFSQGPGSSFGGAPVTSLRGHLPCNSVGPSQGLTRPQC